MNDAKKLHKNENGRVQVKSTFKKRTDPAIKNREHFKRQKRNDPAIRERQSEKKRNDFAAKERGRVRDKREAILL